MNRAIAISVFMFVTPVIADEDTIPVITHKYSMGNFSPYEYGADTGFDSVVSNINKDQLKQTIAEVKETICSAVGQGDVKVYFTFDSKAEVFGIGASAGAGIEVNFLCSTEPDA